MQHSWEAICLDCEHGMPRTNYTFDQDNPVAELFWGRTDLAGATSLFRFEKGSAYQTLIHNLKYRGDRHIGIFLGKLLGQEILNTPFSTVDYIIPVPLHRKKERKRGYNQSDIIALGISEVTGLHILNDLLIRNLHTSSQTHKNRFERWQNMNHVFSLAYQDKSLEGSTFLLIDDVVTTGSTLEACAEALHGIPRVKIFVATVACA